MFWTEENAESMLQVRCQLLSTEWDVMPVTNWGNTTTNHGAGDHNGTHGASITLREVHSPEFWFGLGIEQKHNEFYDDLRQDLQDLQDIGDGTSCKSCKSCL